MNVKIVKLRPNASIPKYMSTGAAGCDLTACLEKSIVLAPGQRMGVPTGLAFEIPQGFEIQVRPRSGFAIKKGLTLINPPGTIDSDYRGEVQVLMVNLGEAPVEIEHGDRIAQLVLQRVEQIQWLEVSDLSDTDRSVGGFGSTGFKNQPSL